MKRYAILAIALGLILGAGARWATSPIRPTQSPYAPDTWDN
jgi:hypothetical protein